MAQVCENNSSKMITIPASLIKRYKIKKGDWLDLKLEIKEDKK